MSSFGLHAFKKVAAFSIGETVAGPVAGGTPNRPSPRQWTAGQRPAPQNVMSQGQLATGMLGSLVGEDTAALLAGFMPLYAPYLKEKGFDLGKNYAIGIGPSQGVSNEQQQVTAALTNQQFTQNADKFKDIAAKSLALVGDTLKKATKDPKDAAKIDAVLNGISGQLDKAPPATVGLIVQQVVQQIPEARNLIRATMPDFVFDYTPLVDMTYRQNGGQWSPELFQKNVQQLNDSYTTAFVPAGYTDKQSILYASQVANEQTNSTNFSPRETLNVIRAGQAFMDSGMANNFEESLGLVHAMAPTAAKNPADSVRQAKWIEAQSRKFGIDPQQFAQAAAMAKQRNIPVATAMAALNYGTRMQQDMQQRGGDQRLGNTLGETYASSDRSKSLKVLQAAVNSGKISESDARVIVAGASNPQAYQSRIKGLMRDPSVAQTWKATDPNALMQTLDPSMVKNLVAADAVSTMGASRGGARLARMLQDPIRAESLAKGVYRGLKPHEINALNSESGRRMLAAAVAKGQRDAVYRQPVTSAALPTANKTEDAINLAPQRKTPAAAPQVPLASTAKPALPVVANA